MDVAGLHQIDDSSPFLTYENDQSRGTWANNAYNAAVAFRLHRVAADLSNPRNQVASRLIYYLNDVGHGPEAGVERVYFGHTHSQMLDFQFDGVRFHNGGAPLKGLKFQMLEAPLK